MMYLDSLGDGLFRALAEEFSELIFDCGLVSMSDLEAAMRLEAEIAARHCDLGRRMLQDAKPVLARQAFTRALELDAEDALSRVGLACALVAMGMTQTAMEQLSQCLERRPEYGPAMVAMEYCARKLGDVGITSENHSESEEIVSIG